MERLHRHLERHSDVYREWHRNPLATVVHLLVLSVFIVFTVVTVTAEPGTEQVASVQAGVQQIGRKTDMPLRSLPGLLQSTNTILEGAADADEAKLGTLIAAAKSRREAMKLAAKNDPQSFLLASIPDDVVAKLPPALQPYIERDFDAEGDMTVIHVDPGPVGTASVAEHTIYELEATTESGKKRYKVNLIEVPQGLTTGSRVRIKGKVLEDQLVAASGGGTTVLSTAVVGAAVDKKVLVILFKFTNNTSEPFTTETIRNTMFAGANSVNNFYNENSFNGLSLSGDVVGWYTIPMTDANCSSMYYSWSNEADKAAQAAGVQLGNYSHIIYVWNSNPGCGWGGLGTIGGTPSRAWIPGYVDPTIYAHEMGHNLGTHHAQWLKCGTEAVGAPATCTLDEYGDRSDVMGYAWGYYHQFNGPRKLAKSWLSTASHMQTVSGPGTYTLSATETNDASLKVLKIPKANTGEFYYVFYRQPLGFDTRLPGAFLNGASIVIWNAVASSPTKLVDTTAGDGNPLNAPLSDGTSFTDTINGITITQLSHSTSSVTLNVNFPAPQCVTAAPSMSISPASQSGSASSTRTYTVSVLNNDSSACVNSNFTLTPTVPDGWSSSFSPSSISVAPGQIGTTIFSLTPMPVAANGAYPFTVSVAGVSAQATFVVYTDATSPVVTIVSPKSGERLKGNSTKIDARATDAEGIASIAIYADGVILKTCTNVTTCNVNWQTRPLTPGTHSITVRAFDKSGNEGSSTIGVIK